MFENTYTDIGNKIKSVARNYYMWTCFICPLIAFILLIVGIANGADANDGGAIFWTFFGISAGVLLLIPITRVITYFLYGFGELVDNSTKLKDSLVESSADDEAPDSKHSHHNSSNTASRNTANAEPSKGVSGICPKCRKNLSFSNEKVEKGNLICPYCNTEITIEN